LAKGRGIYFSGQGDIGPPLTRMTRLLSNFPKILKSLKKATVEWARGKRQKDEHELINAEASLQSIYDSKGGGYASPKQKRPVGTGKKEKTTIGSKRKRVEIKKKEPYGYKVGMRIQNFSGLCKREENGEYYLEPQRS
jgi:hypothetical protein